MSASPASLAVALTTLAATLAATGLAAQPGPDVARPRLAVVLGGGGARGIAHVGALRALEEAGIPVDAIAANSMGAIVGSIYATGKTTAELEAIVRSVDWETLFSGRPDRRTLPLTRRRDRYGMLGGVDFGFKEGLRLPAGALAEHRINRLLIQHLAPAGYAAGEDFDRLAIPFRAVAGALDDGDRVVLARGDLALAVRASMSIPVFFAPVEWHGRRLVDGLIVDNVPVDVARDFGAAVVVAVDVSSPALKPDEYEDAVGVAAQVSDLLTRARNAAFAADPDVRVRPDLGKHKTTDYSGIDALIAAGYLAMKAAVAEIRQRLEAAGVPAPYASRPPPAPEPRLEGAPIRAVEIRGNQRLSAGFLRRIFNVPVGPGYDMEKGLRAFDKADALGFLDRVWMSFEPADGGVRIRLDVREGAPNRVEVGVAFTEWEKARGTIRLWNFNTLGFGEETELLLSASDAEKVARLSLRGDRLLVAGLGYRLGAYAVKDQPRFFEADGSTINRARFDRLGVDARIEVPVQRWALLEAGARFGRVKTHAEAGIDLPDASDTVRMLHAAFVVDDLDHLLWPGAGRRLALSGERSLAELGATYPYWSLQGEGRLGQALGGRFVAQVDAFAGLSGNDVPVYDWFRIGGPRLVPGYHHEELKGPQALAGGLSLRYRVVGPIRLLVRAGAGNVFAARGDITLRGLRWGVGAGVMAPTRVGPLALEIGFRDGGDALVTAWLGWN
jgi:NTE family protein